MEVLMRFHKWLGLSLTAAFLLLYGCSHSSNDSGSIPVESQSLPNMGQQITPLAAPGSTFEALNPGLADKPDWLAGQAVTTVLSPDHKTMLILTSGYNRVYKTNDVQDALGTYFNWPDSKEYVFVYDISNGAPIKKQVVQIPNTYNGIAFDPSGNAFYVASGVGDFPFNSSGDFDQNPAHWSGDNVHIITLNGNGIWAELPGTELALGHTSGNGLDAPPSNGQSIPIAVSPCAAGVALSKDGKRS